MPDPQPVRDCEDASNDERHALRARVCELQCTNDALRRTEAALRERLHENPRAESATARDLNQASGLIEILHESAPFLQKVIDGFPDVVTVVDRAQRIVLANRAAREMAGGKDPVASCLACYQFSRGRDTPCPNNGDDPCPPTHAIATKAPVVFRHYRLDSNGKEIPEEMFAVPILDANGEVTHVIQTCRDIRDRLEAEEERRRLEARLQHAQKLESLGVLAGGIAHDFNNLLVGVLGNAALALEDLPPESPVWERVRSIERAARHAADLTKQLLAYSGKGKFVIESIDLSALVTDMRHLLEASISKSVVLKRELVEALPRIDGDATQLRQVVMNLITNASDAIGHQTGTLSIRTGVVEADREYLSHAYVDEQLPEGPYVYVEVRDTGCGMNAETMARIFDPFFTTKFAGRGLGLACILGIVRGHRGAITVSSEPDRGTTFRVLFPVSRRAVAAALPDHPPSRTEARAATILVVDDEEAVRSVARLVLERSGYAVLTADDGRDALEVYREHADRIDAVILDMTMPHLSGQEVFQEMRRIRADVRVILSSGYNAQEAIGRFAGEGLAGFIQKPYMPQALLDKLGEVVSK